jgi:hypothetical protein
MTPTPHDECGPRTRFAESRARAEQERTDQRNRAVHTIAGNARDREEFTGLLSMLGLDEWQSVSSVLARSLSAYVRQVAAAVGVPADAVGYEVSDTATAYLGLSQRLPEHAGRDLMLEWDERLGWSVGVETDPSEKPLVLGYLVGDTVPPPARVAQFVADAVAGHRTDRLRPVLPHADRITLARQMAAQTQS